MNKIRLMILAVPLAGLLVGCDDGGGNGGNTTRMTVTTMYDAGGARLKDPNATVQGVTLDPPRDSINTISNFVGVTDSNGVLLETNVILPATWGFIRSPTANCNRTDTYTGTFLPNPAPVNLVCGLTIVLLQVAPTTVDYLNPPPTLTISNNQNLFSYISGMPTVSIYDETGTLMSAASANWVSADGNSLTVPLSLSFNMYTGSYAIVVRNVQTGGAQTIVGGAPIDIFDNDPPPPPEPAPDPCGGRVCLPVL